jgi:hypothetical protein
MNQYSLSCSSGADDFEPIVLAVHDLIHRLPITAKSRDRDGIRIEEGRVVDRQYNGPILTDVIRENKMIKTKPKSGAYQGIPVIVTPIRDHEGLAIGAIGVVDITGIFDLATLMEHQSAIVQQVCGKDPCPLPGERSASKR